MYTLTEIYIYPVKSLGRIKRSGAEITERGLKYDRRWLLVDEHGKFITQRTFPQMALISVKIREESLEFINKQNKESFSLNMEERSGTKKQVIIWDDKVLAEHISHTADKWFSENLKIKCSLVYMPESSKRLVDKKYASRNELVSFADAYPFLIIGQSSLDDLNERLLNKVPMNRFRPNLVFNGGNPFDEDRWKSFKIGDVTFYSVKPCSRCFVTTIDQISGIKNEEPLKTLATYRTENNKVMFGQNLLHEGTGKIKVGDVLKIIEWN
jgi:hypothetical protein